MAYIDCVVDTHPMAKEIDSVSRNINGTTAAVVGMKAAIIQAEKEAADLVCSNVNKGFYTLIHSQISQKIAKLQSEVDSHLMRLNQMRKQLLAIKDRMERDYGMLSQRYTKLFAGLNSNLENRIFEIDKPIVQFALKDTAAISSRAQLMTATVPVTQVESLSVSQKLLASNMKSKGVKAIGSMTSFLENMKEQKALTDRIILSGYETKKDCTYLIPVLISEYSREAEENAEMSIYVTDVCMTEDNQDSVKTAVRSKVDRFKWVRGMLKEEVVDEFNRQLAASEMSDRAKEVAAELFKATDYKILKPRVL